MIGEFFQKRQALWKVAMRLAFRQIQHASIWMNLLIILIMVLTFLNLVVITGILTGLIQGSLEDNRIQKTGDILISPKTGETTIINTHEIRQTLSVHPDVSRFSERYVQQATVEANYQSRWDFESAKNTVTASLAGIDPESEDAVSGLSNYIVAGSYLDSAQSGYALIGSALLAEYTSFSDLFDPLIGVTPGTRIKVMYTPSDSSRNNPQDRGPGGGVQSGGASNFEKSIELTIKGILDSKVDEVAGRIFITQADWKRITNQQVDRAKEFAIVLTPGTDSSIVTKELISYGLNRNSDIETAEEAIPSVLIDLKNTFSLLGNIIGGIAVVVSCITVFVVIYINALTRRKQIGILKGIGIKGGAIELAYILQSLFYALVGSAIGFIIIFTMLVPYFEAHPIDFPFSDGILAVTVEGTIIRSLVLVLVTAIAGYIPSWLIVRQNTLNSILGR
jgi:putative ABC transport system permease protein